MRRSAQSIHILIADDHPIFRDGLRRLLETEPDFDVVGEAGDGLEAIKLARRLKPDVLLLDMAMPRLAGLETLRGLSASEARVRTILLTAAITRSEVVEALQSGARGVIFKEAASQLVFKGIRCVAAGEYWVGRGAVTDLVEFLRGNTVTGGGDRREKFLGLTPRELDIVSAIVSGDANKDIARKYSISQETVKHHLTSIYDKLGVSNRLELALLAIERRLVPAPSR